MFTTSINSIGRVIVSDDSVTNDTPQEFTVCVKNESDWNEIHNYIINENNIDDIPNRKISCTTDMSFSPKRSVYSMSTNEADILRSHSKVDWVEQSSMYNPVVLEQRKYDYEFDKHIDIDRFKYDCTNLRPDFYRFSSSPPVGGGQPTVTAWESPINPGSTLDFTQWGLYRHQSPTNNFGTSTTVDADSQYSLSGKNVDVVIMDTGVRWDHPEFWKPGVTSFTDKNDTRVRDILIHGAEEYSIDWSAQGLVEPGSGTLSNYTEAKVLGSSIPIDSYHGSHVAGTAAGNQFGASFEANIWSIACIDRSDVGWAAAGDGFDYIKVWHKNKPINPETGLKNPTVVNCSWGTTQYLVIASSYLLTYRGSSYGKSDVDEAASNVPSVYYLRKWELGSGVGIVTCYRFTTRNVSQQNEADEFVNDSDCQNAVLVCSNGNFYAKQDNKDGIDYDNEFTAGTVVHGGVDNYYTRLGTPAITRQGEDDAVIVVANMDSCRRSGSSSQEQTNFSSNRGPSTDVWAAGTQILSPYSSGYDDPRDTSFHNQYLYGTSMAAPNVTGVIGQHLESNPTATRKSVRKWLLSVGSKELSSDDYYDPYTSNGTNDTNYWGSAYSLKSAPRRILYNPYANNTIPKIVGIGLSGVSITQT